MGATTGACPYFQALGLRARSPNRNRAQCRCAGWHMGCVRMLRALTSATFQLDPERPMDQPIPSRRQFMAATAKLASASWLAMNWPQIAAAAEATEHAGHAGHDMTAPPATLKTLSAAEAAEVDAIANLIVPGGANPGARDAPRRLFHRQRARQFLRGAVAVLPQGSGRFQQRLCREKRRRQALLPRRPRRSRSPVLQEADKTPFFAAVRRLTVLGIIALPKYGGNHDGLGLEADRRDRPPRLGAALRLLRPGLRGLHALSRHQAYTA